MRATSPGCACHVHMLPACLTLVFFAHLLKTLAAKIMATSFHTEAHFHKMQEALQKVRPCISRVLCLTSPYSTSSEQPASQRAGQPSDAWPKASTLRHISKRCRRPCRRYVVRL